MLGDSVGLALLVVLDSLTPAERVAFVLHDVFAVPFDEIAPIVGRTPAATRQLASRARRRVQGAPVPDADLDGQWAVVDAFLAAARDGDFERLLAVLDPDVVAALRRRRGASWLGLLVRGAEAVAEQAIRSAGSPIRRPALVNGIPGGVAWAPDGSPSRSWPSRSGAGGSSGSTCSPTRTGSRAGPDARRRLTPQIDAERTIYMSVRVERAAGVPWTVALFSPVLRFLLKLGVPLGANGLITIRGRTSALPRTAAVAIIAFGGRRALWAPLADVHGPQPPRGRVACRRSWSAVGGGRGPIAIELTRTERVLFFRDFLGPFARSIRGRHFPPSASSTGSTSGIPWKRPMADESSNFSQGPRRQVPEAGRPRPLARAAGVRCREPDGTGRRRPRSACGAAASSLPGPIISGATRASAP